jgi:alcohol dehydrogenase/L-iditol 2-dehydrogenase
LRAITLLGPGRAAVAECPEPLCGPTDVVIQMRAVGLCGSDLSVYSGEATVPSYPWIIGHEGGGEIVADGEEVTDLHVGQVAVIEPNICCSKCMACKAGATSSCINRRALGITVPGIAAERVAVPAEFCWPVAEPEPVALATIEPYAVAGAAARRCGIRPGDRCLVIGAGSQGLMLCVYLASLGVRTFVVEPHIGRLALAQRLGAQQHQPGFEPYPYVFETSGARTALRVGLDATAPAGRLVLIGQNRDRVSLTTRELVQHQITISGSLIYDHPDDFAAAVRSAATRAQILGSVMVAVYPPIEADEAFSQAQGVAGKSWLNLTASWTR